MEEENKQKACRMLSEMGIAYDVIEHPAVYTIEEMEQLNLANADEIVKNLFIRDDKKRAYYLVVLQKDKRADLKNLRGKLESRPLTFASEADLMSILGLTKGAVTPLGILNDESHRVTVVLDKTILGFEKIGIHPNDNTATVLMTPKALVEWIKTTGNPYVTIDF